MPAMLTINNIVYTVGGVMAVQATPIVQDPETGDWLRSVQVFDVPVLGSQTAVPVFTLIVRGATQEAVELSTPTFAF